MKTLRHSTLLGTLALLFLLVQVVFVYALAVVPAVKPDDGTKLSLTYAGGDTGTVYVLKRKAKSATAWTKVAEGEMGVLPAFDGGLTAGVEYEYALFDSSGTTQLQTTPFSAIPNTTVTLTSAEESQLALASGRTPAPHLDTLVSGLTVSPTSVSAGASFTVKGTGLAETGNTVRFTSSADPSRVFDVPNLTRDTGALTFIIPATIPQGTYAISVRTETSGWSNTLSIKTTASLPQKQARANSLEPPRTFQAPSSGTETPPPTATPAPRPDEATTIATLPDLINQVNHLLNSFIPFLVGLAVLVIIWGVFRYISGVGDEEKRAQAKQFILWGVVGVFIMLSVWGLVSIFTNTVVLDETPDVAPLVNPESLYNETGGAKVGG